MEVYKTKADVIEAKLRAKFEACGKAHAKFDNDVVENQTRYTLMQEIMHEVLGVSKKELLAEDKRFRKQYGWYPNDE